MFGENFMERWEGYERDGLGREGEPLSGSPMLQGAYGQEHLRRGSCPVVSAK